MISLSHRVLPLLHALLLLTALQARAQEPVPACHVLKESDIARAFDQRATQVEAEAKAPSSPASSNHCQWRLQRMANANVTLTIDHYASGAELEAAWRAARDTYLHAGRLINGLGGPAMWLPKKYGATGLLYIKSAGAVCVITVPRSSAHELRAARVLAKLVLQRLSKTNTSVSNAL